MNGDNHVRSIRGLRWWIAGLLFASTVINFIDRQSLSALAPFLKVEYHWSNQDFAIILISFRIAYTIMQSVGGRILDRLGTKRGLSLTVAFYSLIAALTSTARGLAGFSIFRCLLGAGEAPNWPGATKAVAEWFPAKERAWAVALFDSGSSIGGLLAPFMVLFMYRHFHSWRPVFLVTGSLGFLWLWFGGGFMAAPRDIRESPRKNSPTSARVRRALLKCRDNRPRFASCSNTARPGHYTRTLSPRPLLVFDVGVVCHLPGQQGVQN